MVEVKHIVALNIIVIIGLAYALFVKLVSSEDIVLKVPQESEIEPIEETYDDPSKWTRDRSGVDYTEKVLSVLSSYSPEDIDYSKSCRGCSKHDSGYGYEFGDFKVVRLSRGFYSDDSNVVVYKDLIVKADYGKLEKALILKEKQTIEYKAKEKEAELERQAKEAYIKSKLEELNNL